MSAELIIYGATYGPEDVTAKVRSLRKDQKLSFTVSNTIFGDPWVGIRKTLVIVYKYAVSHDEVHTVIVGEGSQCEINPPSQQPVSPKNRLDSADLKVIQLASISSQQTKGTGQALVILGAAYGKEDVTQKARNLLSSNGEFDQLASNEVWGDGWPGNLSTLVVMYEYDGLQMLDVVKESERMHFIASPPMTILGAAYGLADVTTKVCELVKNRSLTVKANNSTFGDSWVGIPKTLVVTYQYGEEIPMVSTVKENEAMEILYSEKNAFLGSTDPNAITILGAAYGPSDVTQKAQNLVKGNTLQTKVDNTVFGPDPWVGIPKSLVVVYRYGRNPPLTKIASEGSQMSIAKVVLPYVGLVDTSDLLNDDDVIALSAVNGKYISCDLKDMLVAVEAAPDDGCALTIHKEKDNGAFKLQCSNRKYITVNTGVGSALHATSSAEGATKFSVSVSVEGSLRLATAEGLYVNFDSSDSSVKASSVDQFGAGTIFSIAFKETSDGLSKYMLNANSLSECDLAWASFIWKLTGGFFLAIGLGTFISADKVKPGILGLMKSNPTAWKAIQDLVKAITDGLGSTGALVATMLDVISVLYHEGLLWIIFKEMLKFTGWAIVTWALAKIVQVVFLPKAEAAELLASFTIWGVQTVEAGLAISQACN